jgi:transposase
MTRINNEVRNIFIRLHKQGKKPIEIAQILDTTRQTITNWIRIIKNTNEQSLLETSPPKERLKKVSIEKLKQIFQTRKTAINSELAIELDLSESSIQQYRRKLGYTYKKGTYTYKEADQEAKKI